jgi:hypothetical protein
MFKIIENSEARVKNSSQRLVQLFVTFLYVLDLHCTFSFVSSQNKAHRRFLNSFVSAF